MFKNKYTVGTKDFTKSNGYQKGTTLASNKNLRKNKTKKVLKKFDLFKLKTVLCGVQGVK